MAPTTVSASDEAFAAAIAGHLAASAGIAAARQKEYYFYETVISGFNSDCLEIKKWSVTAASAVAVAGQVSGASPLAQLVVIGSLALSFWVTETVWRINQWSFIRRVQELEHNHPELAQISHSWVRYYHGRQGFKSRFAEQDYESYMTRTAVPVAVGAQSWAMADGEASTRGAVGHFFAMRTCLPHLLVILLAGLVWCLVSAQQDQGKPKPVEQRLTGDVTVRIAPPPAASTGPQPSKPLG